MADEPTVGCCWDADRLDLPRVGIQPAEALMSAEEGRRLARRGMPYPPLLDAETGLPPARATA